MASTVRDVRIVDPGAVATAPQLVIDVSRVQGPPGAERPHVELDGRRVHLATRHTAWALRLLASRAHEGIMAIDLARELWPDGPEDRLLPRLRTCLWQLRAGLGDQSWRVGRRGPVVLLDLTRARVIDRLPGRPDPARSARALSGDLAGGLRRLAAPGPDRRSPRTARASSSL